MKAIFFVVTHVFLNPPTPSFHGERFNLCFATQDSTVKRSYFDLMIIESHDNRFS